MTISQAFQDDLCSKLRMVGLPKAVVLPLVDSVTRSVRAEGPENVVKRLKVLKQAAVNFIAGQQYALPWISSRNGVPKGPWRPVWKMLASTSHKHRKRAFNAMMVYASLVIPRDTDPTPTQERKFLLSVVQPDSEVTLRRAGAETFWRSTSCQSAVRYVSGLVSSITHDETVWDVWQYLHQRYGTTPTGLRRAEKHVQAFLGHPTFFGFHPFPEVQKTLGELGEEHFSDTHPWNGAHRNWREQEPSSGAIGNIGIAQEPGCKGRAFASPNAVLQAALGPMKDTLMKCLHVLPWDCTHDQEVGVAKVQKWIRDGKTCFSVDLSDATNNFPLSLQMEVLERLGKFPRSTLRLFEIASRSAYKVNWGPKPHRLVSWSVGQPLGLIPSFMTFALSHGIVALAAADRAGLAWSEAKDSFLILGDDFITNNSRLHAEYRALLGLLRCPVSESKCLTSDLAGEFAGKLVTIANVYHGYKYRDISDRSFIAVVRTLGPQAINRKLLTEQQYRYAKLMSCVPEPSGLGFNPSGIPLSQRVEHHLHLEDWLSRSVRPEQKMSIPEMTNAVRRGFRSSWYHVAVTIASCFQKGLHESVEGNTQLISKVPEVSGSAIDNALRNVKLFPARIKDGDPRPNPIDDWERNLVEALAYVETRMGQHQDSPTTACLAPTPNTEGETTPGLG